MEFPGSDDVVLIHKGKEPGDPYLVTVNCPDRTSLVCDLFRIVLDFGLLIHKGDVSTDGKWCYLVLWLTPQNETPVPWQNLRHRMMSACPSSCSVSFYLNQPPPPQSPPLVYLLKIICGSRRGLLHDITRALCDLELTIQRVKVSRTPDDRVMDLFFVTDNLDLLQTRRRQEEVYTQLQSVMGESCTCEMHVAAPEYQQQHDTGSLPSSISELLASNATPDTQPCHVDFDNALSPAHTLLQINCVDHKGLFYHIMKTLKDFDMKVRVCTCGSMFERRLVQIAHGRFGKSEKGRREVDVFMQRRDGGKVVERERQRAMRRVLEEEVTSPVRVRVASRGPDTEVVVANSVEASGRGRPRVFFDVTLAVRSLGVCVFSAEIGRNWWGDREWEVYRFLLVDNEMLRMVSEETMLQTVRSTLMGWCH